MLEQSVKAYKDNSQALKVAHYKLRHNKGITKVIIQYFLTYFIQFNRFMLLFGSIGDIFTLFTIENRENIFSDNEEFKRVTKECKVKTE